MVVNLAERRESGIFYTPDVLANFLASNLPITKDATVLDPAYGNGALLLAVERRLIDLFSFHHTSNLFGCDTKPVNGLLKHLPEANLNKIDFFDYSTDNKHDIIITNPPYVRHHRLDLTLIDKYRNKYDQLKIVNRSADLWVYFIIKSVLHLNENGSIGAILPWAVLQSDYSLPLRRWLSTMFESIKICSFSTKYFEHAEERVVVLILDNYGNECKSVEIGFSKDAHTEIEFAQIGIRGWNNGKVLYNGNTSAINLVALFKEKYGFRPLRGYADAKIGVVSGADNYFILQKKQAKSLKIPRHQQVPILTSAKQLPDYILKHNLNLKVLLKFNAKDHLKFRKYIASGVLAKYNLRSHSKLRKPWYKVKIGKVPDGFFPYRVSKIPSIILNESRSQCTNSFHRIYFHNASDLERKWIVVSMLSSIGQLSLELNAKSYGRGLLKIEPNALKDSIVLKRGSRLIEPIYRTIVTYLSEGKKDEAVQVASAFLYKYLNIDPLLQYELESSLINLQAGRIK